MARETKVGLMVALTFLLLVSGVLGYKLCFTGDPLLTLPDADPKQVAAKGTSDNSSGEVGVPKADDAGTVKGEPTTPVEGEPTRTRPMVKQSDRQLALIDAQPGKPEAGPPPPEEPGKPTEGGPALTAPPAGNRPEPAGTELPRFAEGPPLLGPPPPGHRAEPKGDESARPALVEPPKPTETTGRSEGARSDQPAEPMLPPLPAPDPPSKPSPPSVEEAPRQGPPPVDRPMIALPAEGPPPPDEPAKPAGVPADRPMPIVTPMATEGPSNPRDPSAESSPSMPPLPEQVQPPARKTVSGAPTLPPPQEDPAGPASAPANPIVGLPPLPAVELPAKPAGAELPVQPTDRPAINLPPSPPPPAGIAPRIAGTGTNNETPKDIPPPPPPTAFERKYDAPVLGKPIPDTLTKGAASATPASRQADRSGIPLTVRPQPGSSGRNDAGIPVVVQPPTWSTPDGRAPAQVESFDMEVYVLKPGDTYATVSQLRYRSERYQNALAQFNRERDPRLASPQPGMAVYLPPAGYLERRFGVPNPAADIPSAGSRLPQAGLDRLPPQSARSIQPATGSIDFAQDTKAAASADWAQSTSSKRYRVRANDTIWSIAKTTLGNGERWPDILKLNRDVLRDVNQLQVGMVLRLPEDARVDGPENPQ